MQSTESAVKFVNLACPGVSNADQISNLTVVMNASTLTGVSHVKVIVCIAPFMHIYIHHVQWICNVICIACYGGSVSFICHQGWVPGVWQFLHSEHPCLLQNKAIWWVNFVIIVIFQVLTILWTWLLIVGSVPVLVSDNNVLPAAGHTIVIRGCAPFTSEVTSNHHFFFSYLISMCLTHKKWSNSQFQAFSPEMARSIGGNYWKVVKTQAFE